MHQQPRIAFLSEHANPVAARGGVDAGGQNVYVDELSRNLGGLGYRIDIYVRREDRESAVVVEWAPNVRLVNVPAGPAERLPKDQLWPLMPAFRDALLRLTSRDNIRYDLVHGNFWMSGWVASELKRRSGLPVVQIFHATGKTKQTFQGADDTSPAERIAVEMEIVGAADRLIAQCPAERRELIEDYRADPAKVDIIPSAVNIATFRPVPRAEARRRVGLPPEGAVVAYVGRMLPRKDIRNVVRAMALLARRGASSGQAYECDRCGLTLLLVGGETEAPDATATPEIGQLMQLAFDLRVADMVRFAGRRQPDELLYYYSAADVVVTTPWYEPFGLTPLEAMACGRPVIGSAVGGIAFTVVDGETGFLVPPRDPMALSERLDKLLASPELRDHMGAAARGRVEREFTWPGVASRTSAVYQSIMHATPVEELTMRGA